MYQRKTGLQNLMIIGCDCLCIVLSLMLANYIRNHRVIGTGNFRTQFLLLCGVCLCTHLLVNLFFRVNHNFFIRGIFHELLITFRNNIIILLFVIAALYYLKIGAVYSRLALLYFLVIDSVMMWIVRQFIKRGMPFLYKHILDRKKLLIIADQNHASDLLYDLKETNEYTYEIVGIILTDPNGMSEYEGIPVVSDIESAIEYCTTATVDEVIVASDDKNVAVKGQILLIMEALSEMGVAIHYEMGVPELNGSHTKVLSQFGRFYTITYANKIAPIGQMMLKYIMDIVGGIVGCIFLVLMTIIIGPVIKINSPGPVFFKQPRIGRNGRVFNIYKFRSMYIDAEERKKDLMKDNEMTGLVFKMENDPRITGVGKFLRKTSLDEWPQFINVLKGDMSLVGTRPPTLDEFEKYSPYHKKRLSFRPGITGLWQVSGRNDISDFEEIVRMDVAYIDNWSIYLDVKIILKTIGAAISGR